MKDKIKFSKLLITAAIFFIVVFGFSNSAKAGVIFEDDFSRSDGWVASYTAGITTTGLPTATDGSTYSGYRRPHAGITDTYLGVEHNAGKGGNKPALKMGYAWGASDGSQPGAIGFVKHLTGNKDTGYDELYVRYVVKFDDNWKVGSNGTDAQSWKWMRFWQHRYPTNVSSSWSEVNPSPDTGLNDSRYIIMNLNGSQAEAFGVTCNANNDDPSGSVSGAQARLDWYGNYNIGATSGKFEGMDWNGSRDWQIAKTGDTYPGTFKNTYPGGSQGWHTVEVHVKLSTIDQPGNGVFELWLDGIKQTDAQRIQNGNGASGWTALPTKNYNPNNASDPDGSGPLKGGGINFLEFFDNIQAWTKYWDIASPPGWPIGQKFLYIDSIVVSTTSIGTSYVVGGGTAVYQCSDIKDNDSDGKIDYPADPGCTSATDNDETDITTKTYSLQDFINLIPNWLKTISSPSDINSDGTVNSKDLGIMMSNWQ